MGMVALRWCRPIRCSPTQKLILWALADRADDETGEAWPAVADLMEATCLSERSVRGALRDLEALGLMKTTPGGGRNRTSTYRLAMDEKGAAHAETRQALPPIAPQEKGQLLPKKGQLLHEKGQLVPEKGHVLPPNPQEPKEPTRTHSARTKPPAVAVTLPPWLPASAWDDWCAYRRGKTWTQRAAELSIAELGKLAEAGHDPRKVIEQSIRNGWRGLFPTRDGAAPRNGSAPQREALHDTIADIMRDPFGGSARTPGFDFDGHAEEAPA